MAAAGKVGWHGHRDATLLLLAYRHAQRVSELSSRWDAVDLKVGQLHVARLKNGLPSVHPLRGPDVLEGLARPETHDGMRAGPPAAWRVARGT
jgi:hypothetical protein